MGRIARLSNLSLVPLCVMINRQTPVFASRLQRTVPLDNCVRGGIGQTNGSGVFGRQKETVPEGRHP